MKFVLKPLSLPFPFRSIIFWMVLFIISRGIFIAQLTLLTSHSDLSGWPLAFLYGLKLDLSASAYLTAIPALIWLTGIWSEKSGIIRSAFRINSFLLFLVLLVLSANLAVYSAWGTQVNYRAISFLMDPEGIIASVSNIQLIGMVASIFAAYLLLFRLQKMIIHLNNPTALSAAGKWSITLLVIATFPVMMRGGLQVIPVNGSTAWYSESLDLNDAASNPVWYLSDNINRHRGHSSDEFDYLPQAKADSILNSIFTGPAEQNNPTLPSGTNIIVMVLESWTSDIIAPLGGEQDVTPFFNSLCDSGLLFTSIYASGSRTDHMFPSILSGLPALPNKSVVRFNDKLSRLPMLPRKLRNAGYSSLFFYGGELGFANMNTFLRYAGFNRISGIDDYPTELHTGKWGAADGAVFDHMVEELRKQESPFFSMLLTLSTHEPFDVPGQPSSGIGQEADRFRNAALYTDRSLSDFFSKASKESWYKNTLFILVADHGHILPKRRYYYDPETHRIPLLFTGPALPSQWRGLQLHQDGGQHDIPATLLGMLGIGSGDLPFSGDLLDSIRKRPVYINYEAGIGWKERNRQFVLLTDAKRTLAEFSRFGDKADSIPLLNRGKSYVQCLNRLFESY